MLFNMGQQKVGKRESVLKARWDGGEKNKPG